jgi:predicted phosphodiesterase
MVNEMKFKHVEGIKIIQHVLPHTLEQIEIIPIGDVHIGDSEADIKALQNVVNYVLDKPNRYVILNGDLMNTALKTSVSDVYGELLSPMEQVQFVKNILMPIKDRVLALGQGNHEMRTYLSAGIDITYMLALEMGIQDRYCQNSFVVYLKVGESQTSRPSKIKQQVYTIFVQHGRGGGRKMGAKVNRLVDMDDIICNADLYIMGHVHTPVNLPQSTFVSDEQNMTISRHTGYYMIHNAFLDFGGYGLTYGFRPTSKSFSKAILYTKGRKEIELSVRG